MKRNEWKRDENQIARWSDHENVTTFLTFFLRSDRIFPIYRWYVDDIYMYIRNKNTRLLSLYEYKEFFSKGQD